MKKSILTLAAASLMFGTVTTGCKSNTEKEADAIENVQDATEDLNEVSQDVKLDEQLAANDEEWKIFKSETETKIAANETIINNLKAEMNKPGSKYDAVYAKNIELLEKKNANLRSRIADYDKTRSDWESFKREFNSDMDELGKSLKDLTVDNKK